MFKRIITTAIIALFFIFALYVFANSSKIGSFMAYDGWFQFVEPNTETAPMTVSVRDTEGNPIAGEKIHYWYSQHLAI